MSGVPKDRRLKLVAIAIVIGVTLSGFASHLFYLQVMSGSVYTDRASRVSQRTERIQPTRGRILDRSAIRVLATDSSAFSITLRFGGRSRSELHQTVSDVADLLEVDVVRMTDQLEVAIQSGAREVLLADSIDLESVSVIAERSTDLPGIVWEEVFVRRYTSPEVFAPVIGYVGEIEPSELQVLYNQGYRVTSRIGKVGVERQYDAELAGTPGSIARVADAFGTIQSGLPIQFQAPTPGHDVVLTLDADIQQLVFDAIGDRVGAAVVLRPATGEILAMVSKPSYNANRFSSRGGQSYYEELTMDPDGVFLNRTIESVASPGSTFKVVMTTAILEEDAFPVQQTIFDPGNYTVGDRVFLDHKKYGHGYVALFEALAESCNTYFYTMGNEYLGPGTIIEYALRSGLGSTTGVDLPGEVSGLVPSPEWKLRQTRESWRPGDTVNISIGQGYLEATPIQMANVVAQIVNDGVVYRPRVVRAIRDAVSGQALWSARPEIINSSPVSPATFEAVRQAMRGVVEHGTPAVVLTTPALLGGKTGTAETGDDEANHSWFIGFSEVNIDGEPEIIVSVVWIDASNAWDWWAAYATNIIIHGISNGFDYLQTIEDLRTLRDPWLWYGRGVP